MDVQNIQSKIYLGTKFQQKNTFNFRNGIGCGISCVTNNQFGVREGHSLLCLNHNSPSFSGLFSRNNESIDDKPFKPKFFSPMVINKNARIFINTAKASDVLKILQEKWFYYDTKYKYEVLTQENKKALTRGQVDIINRILNVSSCVNTFNVKDFDFVLKLKDKDFVDACLDYNFIPLKIQPDKIEVLKYLSKQYDNEGDRVYEELSVDDINNLTLDEVGYFDALYKMRHSKEYGVYYDRLSYDEESQKERKVFLQNKENGKKLLDFYSQNNLEPLNFELSKLIVSSKNIDDWLLILSKIVESTNSNLEKQKEFFYNIAVVSDRKDYNPQVVSRVVILAEKLGVELHNKYLFDARLSEKICQIKDGDTIKFALKTGVIPDKEQVNYIKKLQEKRELTDKDYAVFEYATKAGIFNQSLDIISNKPNLVEMIYLFKIKDNVNFLDEQTDIEKEKLKSFLLRTKDLSPEEKEVCQVFLNRKQIDYSVFSMLTDLEKVGWLKNEIFDLNYNLKDIATFLCSGVGLNSIKTVLDYNILGFYPNKFLKLGNYDEKVALSRIASLKEISEIGTNLVDKLVMNNQDYDNVIEFIKKGSSCGLDEDLLEKGLILNCTVNDIEKIKYISEKAPQLLEIGLGNKIKNFELLYSYVKETLKPDGSGLLYDKNLYAIAVEKNIAADKLIYIHDMLETVPNAPMLHFVKIIGVLDEEKKENLLLKDYIGFSSSVTNSYNLMLILYPAFKNSLLYKEIKKQGGLEKILSSMIQKKATGVEPLPVMMPNAQARLFNILDYKKLQKTLQDVNFDKYRFGFKLSYTRQALANDLKQLCKKYSTNDVKKVESIYNFSFDLTEGVIKPQSNMPSYLSLKQKKLCSEIDELINTFLYKNKIVLSQNPDLENLLNSIISFFPEFMSLIGKTQHHTHNYTVDVHTLKVLQACVQNPEYKDLSAKEKIILNLSVLLHDIGKKEGVVDDGHYTKSANESIAIFKKLKLDNIAKERIYNLILNHHWLGNLEKRWISADEVAVSFRSPSDFKLAKIFAQADLKGVSDEFYNRCKGALIGENIRYVEKQLNHIYKTSVPLFTNKIVKKAVVPRIDGVKVVDVVNHPELVSQIFGQSVKSREDLRFLVHMFNSSKQNLDNLLVLSNFNQECVLSTSYVSYDNKSTYLDYKFGIFVDVPTYNVLLMNNRNMSSGFEKNKESMLQFLNSFVEPYAKQRKYQIEPITKELNITRNEYAQLYKNIADCRGKTQIKDIKIGDRTLKKSEIIGAINCFEKSYLVPTRHNEVVVYNPKISGLIAMVDKYDEVPSEMKEFAKKYDLPIIIFGKN